MLNHLLTFKHDFIHVTVFTVNAFLLLYLGNSYLYTETQSKCFVFLQPLLQPKPSLSLLLWDSSAACTDVSLPGSTLTCRFFTSSHKFPAEK